MCRNLRASRQPTWETLRKWCRGAAQAATARSTCQAPPPGCWLAGFVAARRLQRGPGGYWPTPGRRAQLGHRRQWQGWGQARAGHSKGHLCHWHYQSCRVPPSLQAAGPL